MVVVVVVVMTFWAFPSASHVNLTWCITVLTWPARVVLVLWVFQGLIVGYVGASHIPDYKKDTHAEMLMSGKKAENGKGAEIVISKMADLPKIIDFFAGERMEDKSAPFEFPEVRKPRAISTSRDPDDGRYDDDGQWPRQVIEAYCYDALML